MKKAIWIAMFVTGICFGQSSEPKAAPAPPPGPSKDEMSNEQAGVDIDRFIGSPVNKPVHLSHGTLLTHDILHNGNPYEPGPQGAVLEYRRELATATLLGMNRTPLSTLPDEYFFYVQSGEGRLEDGKLSWPLRPGIAVLAPPNVPHRFINTTDHPLDMIMLQWTAAGTPKSELIVRDVNLLNYCEENAHWNNTSKCIFGAADGLFASERMYLVMLQPWAVSAPHSHGQGTEEVWTKVTPGDATMMLGSELREMPQNAAYLVPPTGFTKHANLNMSKDRVEWWLYVARGPAQPNGGNGGGGRGRGGRGPANPNLSRDVTQATIAGTPIK
jgi:mannose-6-phosphate isomerase-like protein (cupin superfamily)